MARAVPEQAALNSTFQNQLDMDIHATGITKIFDKRPSLMVWHDLSFGIPAGSSMAILGSAHSGKTTLIRTLAGLETLSSGRLVVFGRSLETLTETQRASYRREVTGLVSPDIPWLPHFSLKDNVALPLLITNVSYREAEKQVTAVCDLLKLPSSNPDTLTVLERQWWSLARGLIHYPKLLLIDELDSLGNELDLFIEQLFVLLPIFNTTLVFSTQHPRVAAYAEHILSLNHIGFETNKPITKTFA